MWNNINKTNDRRLGELELELPESWRRKVGGEDDRKEFF
jgi:hypothetical protein